MNKFFKSFVYAFRGLNVYFRSAGNVRVHMAMTVLVIAGGFYYHLGRSDWEMLLICIGMVLIAEAFNTSIEWLMDHVSPEYHERAGQVKDIAAGAVLIAAIITAIVGCLIFIPKITGCC